MTDSTQFNKNNKEDRIITIYLQDSANAKFFNKANLVHNIGFEKATQWIEKKLKKIKAELEYFSKENTYKQRFQDTISIMGSRGSGKTSFLLSLLKKYKEDLYKENIEVLDVIDPTLIENKGHIFLTIISQIKNLVEEKLKRDDCNPESENYAKKQIWRDKLHSLSHGLPSINDGQKVHDNWQDPEYIMDKGLRAVSSAKELEKNFHEFISYSLVILGKNAFLLSLDDIDVDFQKGWPVLEMLRKYMTTPQIITIISGDIDLFSKAIRKQQWDNFGKALLINEADKQNKNSEYNDLVTEMEGQYLQKVLKPEFRIHLNTLLEKIETYNADIRIDEGKSKNDNQSIKDYYNITLRLFGINNTSQAEIYRSFLLSLPLRTQIQFLSLFTNITSFIINSESEESYTPFKEIDITDPFLSDLFEKKVDVELAKNMPKMLNVVILKLLLNEKVLSENYQLQPASSDGSLNSSLTALSLLFSQKVESNPYLIFDYIIKIGYIRNLLSALGYQDEKDRNSSSSGIVSIESLCKLSGVHQDKVLRDIVGNITAYLRGFLNYTTNQNDNTKPWAGTCVLYGLASKAKEREKNIQNRIDYVFRNDIIKRNIAYIPLSISEPATKNQTNLTYSVFSLLASLSDIIKEKDNLEEILLNFSQLRSYTMPEFRRAIIATDGDEDSEIGGDNTEQRYNEFEDTLEFVKTIKKWIGNYPKRTISPHLLGKISTRFFFALSNIEKNNIPSLGEFFKLQILAFFNAVVIEDVRENYITNKEPNYSLSNLNLNNIATSDTIFINNLSILKSINGDFSFSRWILSCPLFICYLPDWYYIEMINFEELSYNDHYITQDYSLYEKLKKVEIRRSESKKIESLVKFSGSIHNAVKTLEVLTKIPDLAYEQFMSIKPVKDSEEVNTFSLNYKGYFSDKIKWDSIKALQEKINNAILAKKATGRDLRIQQLAQEWQSK